MHVSLDLDTARSTRESLPSMFDALSDDTATLQIIYEGAIANRIEDIDIATAIRDASMRAGIEYLLEIPGVLFSETAPYCFVVGYGTNKDKKAFVICDCEAGAVQLLEYDAIPMEAKQFCSSFMDVISSLNIVESAVGEISH